ncbi:MAG: preprotein translocase subunit SecA [Proteobacteria bacterium]|nr:preprotein translocase subunit SecA [Pseudomonadota bacterium]
MFFSLFDANERDLKKLRKIVEQINSYESEISKLSQVDLRKQTKEWQEEFVELGEGKSSKKLEEILPKAFAMVREASKRTLNKRHYDVQMMAGVALHLGKIAEQKTGEGKTLTATSPLYLNSLTGKGVHLVTANDYLAKHGAGWMAPIYDYLGIKVGVIASEISYIYDSNFNNEEDGDEYIKNLKPVTKKEAYECDITYGTNHEFGFDYLRDNMVYGLSNKVQTNPLGEFGTHYFAVVDEVDFVLIDVARTPLIISTSSNKPSDRYYDAARIVKSLIKDTDYEVDEKFKNSTLTDHGIRKVEKMLGVSNLYEQDFEMVHLIEQAVNARALFEKDKDYIVKDKKIIIVDQFTGRLLPNNRFSNGLHQAIEAKENCPILEESRTMAEISYQNYFRMYEKLAGMTGTAETEAEEFRKIYNLEVVSIPTNNKIARIDRPDLVYKTETGKFTAVADEIAKRHKQGQPVLIGTTSVEKSELLHELLKRRGIPHEILNAKNHEKEASIIANAGKKNAVTVSTNMAGRGVDILLGGEEASLEEKKEIIDLGGLYVIGTERHESRRIDNQLRGRSGRQGDVGESRFYISLQDDLMRIFGGAQVEKIMGTLGLDDSTPIESSMISNSIQNAQKRVEGFNFDRRKQVVELDDVMNVQREVVYKLRDKILNIAYYGINDEWLLEKLVRYGQLDVENDWNRLKKMVPSDDWGMVLAQISLPIIDQTWIDHLVDMDQVKEGIGLKGYAQRDPMVEYKREGHERFELLITKIYTEITQRIAGIMNVEKIQHQETPVNEAVYNQNDYSVFKEENEEGKSSKTKTIVLDDNSKIGRNDPCFCGSGKKYKNCHGKN